MNIREFKKIVAEYSGFDDADEISMDMTFGDDLMLDDTTYYEMLEVLEEEFDVDIISYDGEFDSLEDLVRIIKQG